MRIELRGSTTRVLAALALAAAGVFAAASYASITLPLHRFTAGWAAALCACTLADLSVVRSGPIGSGALQLTAVVHAGAADSTPVAVVTNHVNVGGIAQVPIVLFALLLVWPARSMRERALRGLFALPALAMLELATTTLQLVAPLLALGTELQWQDERSWLSGWSAFLESGGRIALAAVVALTIINVSAGRKAAPQNPTRPAEPTSAATAGS